MSGLVPEGRAGAPTDFIAVGRRSRPRRAWTVPGWLRMVVVVAISLALWAMIIAAVRWLFSL